MANKETVVSTGLGDKEAIRQFIRERMSWSHLRTVLPARTFEEADDSVRIADRSEFWR